MVSFFTNNVFPLCSLYTLCSIACGFQILRILYYRHNVFSFQFGFLLLGFVWGLLRAIFWGTFNVWATPIWTTQASILLWFPINIQFATFSLLVLFYAHLVHKSTWEKFTKRIFSISYAASNFILVLLQTVWVYFELKYNDGSTDVAEQQWVGTAHDIFTGSVFLILVLILAAYGWQLNLLMRTSKPPARVHAQVPNQIVPVTLVIFLIFASRCIYDFITAFFNVSISLTSENTRDLLIIFFSYFIWEFTPMVCVLVLFWKIPTTNIGGLTRRPKSTIPVFAPPAPAGRAIPVGPLSRLLDPSASTSSSMTDDSTQSVTTWSSSIFAGTKNSPYSTSSTAGMR